MLFYITRIARIKLLNKNFFIYYAIRVKKTEIEERCPHCGFFTSSVHDRRTRKVRDWLFSMNLCVYSWR
ncbi:transposase family protein [Geobacillus stearothermophilus]|uniref:transposase family protein n=1 Tax=Geobacillus stearothermophilus TaxID=1422 RepID=UPI003D20239E